MYQSSIKYGEKFVILRPKIEIHMFEYHTLTLPSGLRIVHQETDSRVGYCGFMVDCGTRHEQAPSQYGIAHFIEHILFKGTTSRDAWHINQRMESVGGELNAFTTKEDTTFYSAFLASDFPRACELLCDLLCHPTAPQHELEKEQEVVVEEIESYRDNPAELIYDVFEDRLFAGSSLGHNILGNEETVRSFDHVTCMEFIHQNYTPDRMVFFAYGSMKWEQVKRLVEKSFKAPHNPHNVGLRDGSEGLGESSEGLGESFEGLRECSEGLREGLLGEGPVVAGGSRHQSHCMLGCRTYPIGHANAATLALINNILGGPGMNSRLNQQLREKRGLVYTVESSITTFTDTGYFSIYFGCDHGDRDYCLRLCRKELKRIAETPLSQRQLETAKKQLKGQLGIGTANLENNALALAKQIMRRGAIESLEETCARIDAVTTEQVQTVASELFAADRLVTVVLA